MSGKDRSSRVVILLSVLAALSCTAAPGMDRAHAQAAGARAGHRRYTLSNDRVERTIEIRPVLRTVSFLNKTARPPRPYAVESQEFRLTLENGGLTLAAADFQSGEPALYRSGGETRLVVPLTCPDRGVSVEVTYTLGGGSFYFRKRLEVDAVSQTLKWMKANDPILLASVRLFGGDMLAGEAYGYAHFLPGNRGIITLRNPTVEPRTIRIPFDESSGMWPGPGEWVVRQIYPFQFVLGETVRYGSGLTQRLESEEVRVFQVYPVDALPEPMPVGRRYQVTGRQPGMTQFKLAVSGETLELFSPVTIRGAKTVAGKRNRYLLAPPRRRVRLTPQLPQSTAGNVVLQENQIRLPIDVRNGERARVAFLFGDPGVKAELAVDGTPAAAMAPHLRLPDSARPKGLNARAEDWSLFGVELRGGRHDLRLRTASKWRRAPAVLADFRADIRAMQVLSIAHDPFDRHDEIPLPQNWAWEARRADHRELPAEK